MLDWALGGEMAAVYTKNELKELVRMNVEDPERRKSCGLDEKDGKILTGALQFRDVPVDSSMTPLDSCFTLPVSTVLDETTLSLVLQSGHFALRAINTRLAATPRRRRGWSA